MGAGRFTQLKTRSPRLWIIYKVSHSGIAWTADFLLVSRRTAAAKAADMFKKRVPDHLRVIGGVEQICGDADRRGEGTGA